MKKTEKNADSRRHSILKRHIERGDVRKFVWLSAQEHVAPIKAELQETWESTGIHIPFEHKIRQIVHEYCQSPSRMRLKRKASA